MFQNPEMMFKKESLRALGLKVSSNLMPSTRIYVNTEPDSNQALCVLHNIPAYKAGILDSIIANMSSFPQIEF